jgi:hypothetical protein
MPNYSSRYLTIKLDQMAWCAFFYKLLIPNLWRSSMQKAISQSNTTKKCDDSIPISLHPYLYQMHPYCGSKYVRPSTQCLRIKLFPSRCHLLVQLNLAAFLAYGCPIARRALVEVGAEGAGIELWNDGVYWRNTDVCYSLHLKCLSFFITRHTFGNGGSTYLIHMNNFIPFRMTWCRCLMSHKWFVHD